jgi:BirA family transcriptional regulator, biotin operon repressor / biotin---[acetyl-CoA-carboxylase] ligase
LIERLRQVGPTEPPCLLVAEQQTQGRGRQGRSWHAEQGASLTFSLGLPGRLLGVSGLSLVVGVALAEALAALCYENENPAYQIGIDTPLVHQIGIDVKPAHKIGVKWPNDVCLMEFASGQCRKLGGVLIETIGARTANGVLTGATVIGVGLNITRLSHLPVLSSGYACMREMVTYITAPVVLHHIVRPLVLALLEVEAHGFMAFASRFAACDLLHGCWVQSNRKEAVQSLIQEGRALGVTSEGALQLGQADGTVLALHSGEVSIRPLWGQESAGTAVC